MWKLTDTNIPDNPDRVGTPTFEDVYHDPICTCDKCGRKLYEGDEVYDILPGGDGVCEDCLDKHYRRVL